MTTWRIPSKYTTYRFGEALSVNDSGVIVGYCGESITGTRGATLWNAAGSPPIVLPALSQESYAYDINNQGVVVGLDYRYDRRSAVLWEQGVRFNLNDLIDPQSGWTLEYAYAINDAGQIAGRDYNAAGQTRAFLLTPAPVSLLAAVWAGMGLLGGIGAVSGLRRKLARR